MFNMLNEKQIVENWDRFLSIIDERLSVNDRWKKIKPFYEKYEQRFGLMPASSKSSYHSAFPGGYIFHILNVYDCAFRVKKIWEETGGDIDFTDDELIFCALNHDIGKFGTYEHESYIDQDSDWHSKRGEVYKHNPQVPFLKINHRSLFLFQDIGVKLTENEYLTILIHDGLYDEGNKSYWISFSEDYKLRSNLPYIVHQADLMAARIEGDLVKRSKEKSVATSNDKSYPKTILTEEVKKSKRIIQEVPKEDVTQSDEVVPTKTKKKYSI